MDPIIRLPQVSPVARRIGRPQASDARPGAGTTPLAHEAVPIPVSTSAAVPCDVSEILAEVGLANPCGCADDLARAEREHAAVLARRDTEIDTLRESARLAAVELTDAYTDAEERGYAAGAEKGTEAAGDTMRDQVDSLKSLAEEIASALRALTDTAEDVMVDIVFTAICRILGERGASREAVREVVRAAVDAMREREQLLVRLHPDDAALLEHGQGGVLRISADPAVALGGCIIDSPGGSLDARFETQLDALRATLKGVRAGRLAAPEAT